MCLAGGAQLGLYVEANIKTNIRKTTKCPFWGFLLFIPFPSFVTALVNQLTTVRLNSELDTRRRAGYFACSYFVENSASNVERVHFVKKIHQIFGSKKIKKFLYFCKTSLEVEKDILKNSTANMPPLLFLKDFMFLWFRTYLGILTISLPFYGKYPLDHFDKIKIIFDRYSHIFFLQFSEKISDSWRQICNMQQGCRNYNVHHQKNILRENILLP